MIYRITISKVIAHIVMVACVVNFSAQSQPESQEQKFEGSTSGANDTERLGSVLSGKVQLPPIFSVPTPENEDAILLYPIESTDEPPEQWENYIGGLIVRNVINPTLTPYLPDPEKATGAAVIVAPGGGFWYMGMDEDVPRRLAERGIAAFVLKYRLKPTSRDPNEFLSNMYKDLAAIVQRNKSANPGVEIPDKALNDAKEAVRLVRERAAEWNIDPKRIGFMGESAGALLTMAVGLNPNESTRPNFIGCSSGFIALDEVPEYAPPLFLALTMDDPLSSADNGAVLTQWRKAGRPIEAHFYEIGGHGLPSNPGTSTSMWFDSFWAWMNTRGLLSSSE